ncbi:S-layer homology domain-containing protein [Desulfuribacillus alkaliarsenatis]|uniref:SLH domain-containing protein n=1 Tax=Desulfuribacillus alkaliarsenatis TaxID=766136 RepID=A0A1E5FZN3_9FIRM|nr:S-layer homology domain-containing protein [Desulfuribacillus alkaliarsenatis]OEF96036.1 hypothetical protein BHF68_09830 [Desulfuribacillus alkaliarsenatis]
MKKIILILLLLVSMLLFSTNALAYVSDSYETNEYENKTEIDIDIENVNDDIDIIDEVITDESTTDDNTIDESIIIEDTHHYFFDVPTHHYAFESISRLYDIGATNYRQDHKFMPTEWISRGEFLHMLLRAMGYLPVDEIIPVFNDVHTETPFATYVDTAYRLGIVDGLGNNEFRPGDPVRRDALIKMLITGNGLLKYDIHYSLSWTERNTLLSVFKDRDAINGWAEHYITHALKYEIITGYPDQTIRPNSYTTRAEAAVLIDRMFLSDNNEKYELDLLEINGVTIPYTNKIVMEATKYNSNQQGLSNYTRMGLRTRIGAVAVDPNFIPLGTHLYIENYGYAIAADTGGAIRGNKIDLYAASVGEAMQFGRQDVVVYVLP